MATASQAVVGKYAKVVGRIWGTLSNAGKAVVKVVSDSTVRTANYSYQYAKPRLRMFWEYAKVELRPCTVGELPKVQDTFNDMMSTARTGRWQMIPVREALLNTLITLEIIFCFFIGEVLGRGSLVGYAIEGANHYIAEF